MMTKSMRVPYVSWTLPDKRKHFILIRVSQGSVDVGRKRNMLPIKGKRKEGDGK